MSRVPFYISFPMVFLSMGPFLSIGPFCLLVYNSGARARARARAQTRNKRL